MIIIKYPKKRSRSNRSRESKRTAGKKLSTRNGERVPLGKSDSGISRVETRGGTSRIDQWGSANTSVVTRSFLRWSRPIDAGEQGRIHSPSPRLQQYALYSIQDTIHDTIYFTFVYFMTSSCEITVLQTIYFATSIYYQISPFSGWSTLLLNRVSAFRKQNVTSEPFKYRS